MQTQAVSIKQVSSVSCKPSVSTENVTSARPKKAVFASSESLCPSYLCFLLCHTSSNKTFCAEGAKLRFIKRHQDMLIAMIATSCKHKPPVSTEKLTSTCVKNEAAFPSSESPYPSNLCWGCQRRKPNKVRNILSRPVGGVGQPLLLVAGGEALLGGRGALLQQLGRTPCLCHWREDPQVPPVKSQHRRRVGRHLGGRKWRRREKGLDLDRWQSLELHSLGHRTGRAAGCYQELPWYML